MEVDKLYKVCAGQWLPRQPHTPEWRGEWFRNINQVEVTESGNTILKRLDKVVGVIPSTHIVRILDEIPEVPKKGFWSFLKFRKNAN